MASPSEIRAFSLPAWDFASCLLEKQRLISCLLEKQRLIEEKEKKEKQEDADFEKNYKVVANEIADKLTVSIFHTIKQRIFQLELDLPNADDPSHFHFNEKYLLSLPQFQPRKLIPIVERVDDRLDQILGSFKAITGNSKIRVWSIKRENEIHFKFYFNHAIPEIVKPGIYPDFKCLPDWNVETLLKERDEKLRLRTEQLKIDYRINGLLFARKCAIEIYGDFLKVIPESLLTSPAYPNSKNPVTWKFEFSNQFYLRHAQGLYPYEIWFVEEYYAYMSDEKRGKLAWVIKLIEK
jgi:hypothetical protein